MTDQISFLPMLEPRDTSFEVIKHFFQFLPFPKEAK